jgi:spore maturation protein CgeB
MNFLIVDTYYADFLDHLYALNLSLSQQSYNQQLRFLLGQCFGTADFYSYNLRQLDCEAEDVIVNCEPLQRKWAEEQGLKIDWAWPRLGITRNRRVLTPTIRPNNRYIFDVLAAQVRAYKPDVLYVQNISLMSKAFIREKVRPYVKLLVGQHASPLPATDRWQDYDLVLSSLPHQVDQFRQAGIKSEYLAIGFEPSVLDKLGPIDKRLAVVHVGGYSGAHNERKRLLEHVARHIDVEFWGYGVEALPAQSVIKRQYKGEAWGLDMYKLRAGSCITLTKHSAASGPYANNMTLFETTGVGSLLVTDQKSNLSKLFNIGTELVSYINADDCIEKVCYYLEHDAERETIAKAGQERTLRDHTYMQRMQELVTIIQKHL